MELLTDGQHKHGGEKLNCFFCVKYKEHCQYYSIGKSPDDPPEYQTLYNKLFVICPECHARGVHHLAEQIINWMKTEAMLANFGVGLREIEDHKRTGRLPKFKKRKRR